MTELQPLFDLLSAKHGWISAIPVWVSMFTLVMRVIVKPFNERLQTSLTETLARAKSDPETARWWHDKILSRSWYRVGAFLMAVFTSVNLPTHSDFHELTGLALNPTPKQEP